MPTVWLSLKKSLHCKSEPSDVHEPQTRKQLKSILTRKAGRSGCSRSISNLKDVIHGGSKRHLGNPPSCSPRSIGSSEFLNPITHEVILSNSRCELKISGLRPGTPEPTMQYFNPSFKALSSPYPPRRKSSFLVQDKDGSATTGKRVTQEMMDSKGSSSITCHKCGEQFNRWDAADAHHLSKHAVSELVEGDSSRKIGEIICRTGRLKSENQCTRIERIVKVHNRNKTLARFEEYRELVKIRASKLPKKHPRCLADGNELLRFYGTTLACPLGLNGSSSICVSEKCCVCRIIRNGFTTKKELKGGVGVFTTSTSVRAFESIEISKDETSVWKALIVCRVIAGRVHRPIENIQEIAGQTGFDSLAGKMGLYSNIEELYLLNPRALLPCFVIICKP